VARFHEAFTDETTRTEATEILRDLIDRVVLYPEKGGPEIELVGDIARMVELTLPENRNAARDGGALPDAFHRSVKVVAGKRNQRYLQALRAKIPSLPISQACNR